jgi:multisubunit Na+/H+ antiporter MnhC subunit
MPSPVSPPSQRLVLSKIVIHFHILTVPLTNLGRGVEKRGAEKQAEVQERDDENANGQYGYDLLIFDRVGEL